MGHLQTLGVLGAIGVGGALLWLVARKNVTDDVFEEDGEEPGANSPPDLADEAGTLPVFDGEASQQKLADKFGGTVIKEVTGTGTAGQGQVTFPAGTSDAKINAWIQARMEQARSGISTDDTVSGDKAAEIPLESDGNEQGNPEPYPTTLPDPVETITPDYSHYRAPEPTKITKKTSPVDPIFETNDYLEYENQYT